ncbi:hypothetical protein SERLADRAFT_367118 [Serpula lacrymans var. lacrymans S7.9]|uniref:Origin recognition complex subunit 4 C-terminal domain-containing protein n=1 Tax=Serpula lacrymans var. lacrymans (strain S7.9) TaxID=578457 RepID=F8NNC6_SERL9|nr:uncharacterized protein SERLADRAFT_367118 [Serpula lacrymans var. lacrymans S7.9]EGO27556.1 hypothetical protein SERLADRAFT_367118 [Serpula lacrymans var. lacrymans S7.9]
MPSPSKPRKRANAPDTSIRIPTSIPAHLYPCLNVQKRALLSSLRNYHPACDPQDDDGPATNAIAYTQLQDLLTGTITRGEGNSCLLLGPRGSGKTSEPIVIRLSGWVQHTDRLALREVARQLSLQTGKSFLQDTDAQLDKQDESLDENPFLDTTPSISLPPTSHLPALISVIPTLSRPAIIILDAFDLFALHPRQSLLYCLLDTVQSCRVGQGNNGMLVVGVTTRIDTINLLEKRVKSRFSGRMLRTAPPQGLENWKKSTKELFVSPVDCDNQEWAAIWPIAMDKFLEDRTVNEMIDDAFSLTRDTKMLNYLLTRVVLTLKPQSPFPLASHLKYAIIMQQCHVRFPQLHALPYPAICLLIAATHVQTAGHDTFNFEMLHESFQDQVRASAAAPVQIEGGSIGMGFEHLLAMRVFASVAAPSVTVAQEFVRYRCVADRDDVKKAVEKMGQTSLKKWFSRAQ